MIKAENTLKMLKLWNEPKQNLSVNPIPEINLCALFIFFYIWNKYKKKKKLIWMKKVDVKANTRDELHIMQSR